MAPVSPVADFAQPETKEVTLPVTQNGKSVSVLIRAVPVVKLLQALDGIPQLSKPADGAGGTTFQDARALIAEQDGPMRKVAAAGIVAPKFAFNGNPKQDEADWDNVRFANQQAIVSAIMDFSGFTGPPGAPAPAAGEAAQQAEEFRGVAPQ